MRPRMAFSAVVLPAPFGPMSPRMRPSSTRRSMPSSATVVPKTLRRFRASMHAMASVLLLGSLRLCSLPLGTLRLFGIRWWLALCAVQEFFCLQAEPLNGGRNARPLFAKKFLPFALQQQTACPGVDEHAATPSGFDQSLVHQLLIALQDGAWIDSIFSRDIRPPPSSRRLTLCRSCVAGCRRRSNGSG